MEEEVCGEEKYIEVRISMIRDAGNYYFVENDFTIVTGQLPRTVLTVHLYTAHCTGYLNQRRHMCTSCT
jgi:hypothetical protein